LLNWAAPGCLGAISHFKQYYCRPMLLGQQRSADVYVVAKGRQRQLELQAVTEWVAGRWAAAACATT
jgi:hypothetical protein